MGYYIRILSPSDRVASVGSLHAALSAEKLAATLVVESGTDDDWAQLLLAHKDGQAIAQIDRDSGSSNEMVLGAIDEFLEEVAESQPSSASAWLAKYLPTVRTIYSFRLLSGTEVTNGWEILGAVKNALFADVGGILQADGEGFSNEEGYHILWQFSNSVQGTWWMGVLIDGNWIHFQMDLGNKLQREAFLRGEVPEGAKLAE